MIKRPQGFGPKKPDVPPQTKGSRLSGPQQGEQMREAFRAAGLVLPSAESAISENSSSTTPTRSKRTNHFNSPIFQPHGKATVKSIPAAKQEGLARPKSLKPSEFSKGRNSQNSPRKQGSATRIVEAGQESTTAGFGQKKVSKAPYQLGQTIAPMDTRASQSNMSQRINLTREDRWKRLQPRLQPLTDSTELSLRSRSSFPKLVPSAELGMISDRLQAGSSGRPSVSNQSRGPVCILGIDFGTTSTKIVARLPYLSGEPTFAIPVPPFARAEKHAYLWASRLWLMGNGSFALYPCPNSALYCAIKTRLMDTGAEHSPRTEVLGGLVATPEEAATAFLALQIRQAKGWLFTKRTAEFKSSAARWYYNFGFPAASLDNIALRTRYERCVAAAIDIAESTLVVTLDTVKQALAATSPNTKEALEQRKAQLHPEIAAAVAGFAHSMKREDGLYALVDVGGSTVDCCTFNLVKNKEGGDKCPIFSAQVELLGVEPWRLCEGDDEAEADFRYLLDSIQWQVVNWTKVKKYPNSTRWNSALPMFLIGGGFFSAVHRESTAGLDTWLRKLTAGNAGVRIELLPPPENLYHPECLPDQVQRLGVAIGLSLPEGQIPEVELPHEIDDYKANERQALEARYVDKDQV